MSILKELNTLSEGFMGLTVGASDNASDAAYEVGKVIAKELRRQMKEKGNQYNTPGPLNVAMIIGEMLQEFDGSDEIQAVAKEVKGNLEKDGSWKGVGGYAAVMKRLDKFIAKAR